MGADPVAYPARQRNAGLTHAQACREAWMSKRLRDVLLHHGRGLVGHPVQESRWKFVAARLNKVNDEIVKCGDSNDGCFSCT